MKIVSWPGLGKVHIGTIVAIKIFLRISRLHSLLC